MQEQWVQECSGRRSGILCAVQADPECQGPPFWDMTHLIHSLTEILPNKATTNIQKIRRPFRRSARTFMGGLPPPLIPHCWIPSPPSCQILEAYLSKCEAQPPFQPGCAKTLNAKHGSPSIDWNHVGLLWGRGKFGSRLRELRLRRLGSRVWEQNF